MARDRREGLEENRPWTCCFEASCFSLCLLVEGEKSYMWGEEKFLSKSKFPNSQKAQKLPVCREKGKKAFAALQGKKSV